MSKSLWRVYINGKDTGIIESNMAWAFDWWNARANLMGYRVAFKVVD